MLLSVIACLPLPGWGRVSGLTAPGRASLGSCFLEGPGSGCSQDWSFVSGGRRWHRSWSRTGQGSLAADFVCDSEGGDGPEELTREKTKPGREGSRPPPARP